MSHSILKHIVLILALCCYLIGCAPIDRPGIAIESREPRPRLPNPFNHVYKHLKAPNRSIFWSGQHPHPKKPGHLESVKGSAQRFAAKVKGHTINMQLKTWPVQPKNQKMWEAASRAFARNSKGTVHAVLGSFQKANSVWNRIEKPALMDNPKVHTVVEVDPKTHAVVKHIKGGPGKK